MFNPLTGKTIFVQIASFRDSQLLPTLKDMLNKADEPENLKICICWQHSEEDDWDTLSEYKNDDRFIIIDIKAEESKGVCWARHLIQQKYNNEDFTLQLDSHHRFVKHWDTELKNEILQLHLHGYKKPLLTGYITSFHPSLPKSEWGKDPWQMVFDRFTPEGVVFFKPSVVPDWEKRTMPVKGRFYSAHFAFTLGKFCKEVPHDPRYYFHGEEITIGVRAFTHGYDIFHPHRIVAYHEFSRDYRPDKHWDTYTEWGKHNAETYSLMKSLLGIDGESCSDAEKYGKYGLGNKRSIEDWQIFAGVNFSNRTVQQETIDGCIPPNDPDGNWSKFYKHCLNIDKDKIPQDNIEYIVVALHDKEDNTVYRKDISGEELNAILSGDIINIWVEDELTTMPDYYVVWPYSTVDGWCERLTGNL